VRYKRSVTPTDEDLLTPTEVAELCRTSKTTVFRWADDGRLPILRLSDKVIRFRRADVEAFIARAAS
jgi:excisionase family DNA binding protein